MTIKELHDNLYDENIPINPKLFMDNYEENMDLISKVDLTNLNDFGYAMRLTCDYGIILENSGNLLKGLMYLDEAIEMMENFPNYQKNQLFNQPYYELVVFHKARAFYNLRNYKDSQLSFDRLNKALPNNDKYQIWTGSLKVRRYDKWIGIGLGVMLVTLIVRTFLDGKYTLLDEISYWILLFSMIFAAIFEVVKLIEKRKLKKMKIS